MTQSWKLASALFVPPTRFSHDISYQLYLEISSNLISISSYHSRPQMSNLQAFYIFLKWFSFKLCSVDCLFTEVAYKGNQTRSFKFARVPNDTGDYIHVSSIRGLYTGITWVHFFKVRCEMGEWHLGWNECVCGENIERGDRKKKYRKKRR